MNYSETSIQGTPSGLAQVSLEKRMAWGLLKGTSTLTTE